MAFFNKIKLLWIFLATTWLMTYPSLQMGCSYGSRGSLTAICVGVSSSYFKLTPYRFDQLDETLKCINCTLTYLEISTFDLPGNRIKELDIRNSSIEHIKPKAFMGLIFMETLLLSHNSIKELQPGAFIGVRKIKTIELENALSNLKPLVFKELHLLENINLKNNNITEIKPDTFKGLHSLKVLDLSHNKLVYVDQSFEELPNLQILKLNNNGVFGIHHYAFFHLTNLLFLDLSNNKIMNYTVQMDRPNKLRTLTLSGNRLDSDGIEIGVFGNLYNLEELNLNENVFKTIPNGLFQGLYHLTMLSLADNELTEFPTGRFTGLPSLRTLNLSSNFIKAPKATGRMILMSLHSLDISNNKISEFNYLDVISRMPHISFIDLRNNSLPCQREKELEIIFHVDNVNFLMSSKKPPTEPCKIVPKTPEQLMDSTADEFVLELHGTTHIAWMYVLFTIIVVLIAVLFYVQFFILYKVKYNAGKFRLVNNQIIIS